MSLKTSIYVCSKPLQYFNIRNLPRDTAYKNILIVEDKFKDAHKFYEQVIKYDRSWNKVHFAKDRSRILLLCLFKYRVTNLYYYMDFMLKPASLLYVVPCKNIFIYEEGISAYRTDMFKKTAGYKRKIRKLLGISEYAGLHPRAKGIYVYCKGKYLKTFSSLEKERNLNPLPFNVPFHKMIENNLELALEIFQFDAEQTFAGIKNKKVLFYITSWPLDENVLRKLHHIEYDFYIIKPHPHIREINLPKNWKSNKTLIIESVILAEFLIEILIERNNILDIYHHNSSAVMYLDNYPNIRSVITV
jgi:hypothetical protein